MMHSASNSLIASSRCNNLEKVARTNVAVCMICKKICVQGPSSVKHQCLATRAVSHPCKEPVKIVKGLAPTKIEPFCEENVTNLIDTLFGLFPTTRKEDAFKKTYVQKLRFIRECLDQIDPDLRQQAADQVVDSIHTHSSTPVKRPYVRMDSHFMQRSHYYCSLHSFPKGIIVHVDKGIQYVNGLLPDQVTGHLPFDSKFIHSDDTKHTQKALASALRKGNGSFNTCYRTATRQDDGQFIYQRTFGWLNKHPDGTFALMNLKITEKDYLAFLKEANLADHPALLYNNVVSYQPPAILESIGNPSLRRRPNAMWNKKLREFERHARPGVSLNGSVSDWSEADSSMDSSLGDYPHAGSLKPRPFQFVRRLDESF